MFISVSCLFIAQVVNFWTMQSTIYMKEELLSLFDTGEEILEFKWIFFFS